MNTDHYQKLLIKNYQEQAAFPDAHISRYLSKFNSVKIEEDYSMGYPEVCGFRAGICTPFKFYDLLNETETDLTFFHSRLWMLH